MKTENFINSQRIQPRNPKSDYGMTPTRLSHGCLEKCVDLNCLHTRRTRRPAAIHILQGKATSRLTGKPKKSPQRDHDSR